MKNFLITPEKSLKQFIHNSDRVLMAKPLPVEIISTCVLTRLVTVRCLIRGVEFPCDRRNLRSEASLTVKERALVASR